MLAAKTVHRNQTGKPPIYPSFEGYVAKHSVAHPYSGIPFGLRKEGHSDTYNVDDP